MAKVIAVLIYCIGFLCSSTDCVSQAPFLSGQRAAVVASYRAQIGVREATGHNDGAAVVAYLQTVGLGKGYAWCAAFVKWNLFQGKVTEAGAITGAAASCYKKDALIFYAHRWHGEPLPGDVFVLYYNSLGRIGHTGFFDSWGNRSAGTIISVEGNTNGGGSRDGDGVYRRIRQAGTIYAISRWIK